MKNSSLTFQEARFNWLTFHDFHEDQDIESLFLEQKYRQNISLKFSLSDDTKLALIGKGLQQQTHLVGLKISLKQCSFAIKESSFKDIFSSLKYLSNLKNLILDIQNPYLARESGLIQILSNSISCLSQLERLELILPTFQGTELKAIKYSLEPLNCLKELRIITPANSVNGRYLNDFFAEVYKKQSLLSFFFNVFTAEYSFPPRKRSLWEFNNMIGLQELQVRTNTISQKSIPILSEQIIALQTLIRLELDIRAFETSSIQVKQLFDSILCLERLEELNINLYELQPDIIDIVIGEEVCKDSKLRKFSFLVDQSIPLFNHRVFVLGKQILNVKHLEKLNIILDSSIISDQSFELLSEWKKEWNELVELSFDVKCFYNSTTTQQQMLKIISFLRDCFQTVKSIQIFKTSMKLSNLEEQSDLLYGLGQLKNLQTLKCLHLYEPLKKNIQQEYVQCFQRLQSLKKLRVDAVKDNEEVLCLGLSLQYLNNLSRLTIVFKDITQLEHFQVFCRNLKYLTELKDLFLQIESSFKFDNNISKLQEIQRIYSSISAVQSLNQLDIFIRFVEADDQRMFVNELVKISQVNKHLYVLSLHDYRWILQRNKISRHFKRLVKLSMY